MNQKEARIEALEQAVGAMVRAGENGYLWSDRFSVDEIRQVEQEYAKIQDLLQRKLEKLQG